MSLSNPPSYQLTDFVDDRWMHFLTHSCLLPNWMCLLWASLLAMEMKYWVNVFTLLSLLIAALKSAKASSLYFMLFQPNCSHFILRENLVLMDFNMRRASYLVFCSIIRFHFVYAWSNASHTGSTTSFFLRFWMVYCRMWWLPRSTKHQLQVKQDNKENEISVTIYALRKKYVYCFMLLGINKILSLPLHGIRHKYNYVQIVFIKACFVHHRKQNSAGLRNVEAGSLGRDCLLLEMGWTKRIPGFKLSQKVDWRPKFVTMSYPEFTVPVTYTTILRRIENLYCARSYPFLQFCPHLW